jgi:hypothetical protein
MTRELPMTRMRCVRRPVAMLLATLLLGAAGQQLFFAREAGVNVLVATLLLLSLAWWLRPADRRPVSAEACLPAAAVVFAAFCAIRADAALLVFDSGAAAALTGASIVAFGGVRVTRLDLRALLLELTDLIGGAADRPVRLARAAAGPLTRQMRSRGGRVTRYASGVAFASPFLIVFSALFASADPVYDRRVGDLLGVVRDLSRDAGPRLLLLVAIAWVAGAALAKLADRPSRSETTDIRSRIPIETATVLLACVDLLFAVFVVFQIGYLFGGRDTIDAAGIPYSAYARRGFFELVGCASLVGALLFAVSLLAPARSRVTAALAVVLVGLTLVILGSAWYRLDLYQQAYGWTELRFYVVVGIVFLAFALLIVAWSSVHHRMRFALQPLIGAALVVALGVNVVSPSAFVARADLQRLIDPSQLPADAERRMDPANLMSLGDGAYPVLVELLPSLPQSDQNVLRAWLDSVAPDRATRPEPWESFNVDRARAREALRAGARSN